MTRRKPVKPPDGSKIPKKANEKKTGGRTRARRVPPHVRVLLPPPVDARDNEQTAERRNHANGVLVSPYVKDRIEPPSLLPHQGRRGGGMPEQEMERLRDKNAQAHRRRNRFPVQVKKPDHGGCQGEIGGVQSQQKLKSIPILVHVVRPMDEKQIQVAENEDADGQAPEPKQEEGPFRERGLRAPGDRAGGIVRRRRFRRLLVRFDHWARGIGSGPKR